MIDPIMELNVSPEFTISKSVLGMLVFSFFPRKNFAHYEIGV